MTGLSGKLAAPESSSSPPLHTGYHTWNGGDPVNSSMARISAAMDNPTRKTETILIVEDDAGLARLQRMRLERSGFSIFVAGTFEEALTTVQSNHIDLVLLDYQLPGGRTGLEVQAEL